MTLYDAHGNPIKDRDSSKVETREIATIAKDPERLLVGELLPFTDDILTGRLSGSLRAYRKLLTDDQVMNTFQQRRDAVISREWEVEPGGTSAQDKAAAESLKEQLKAVGWDKVTGMMLFGVFYGYAVAEMLWAKDVREIFMDNIRVKDRSRFRIDQMRRLRLLTREAMMDGELLPPRKFWWFSTGADNDDDPYGMGLAHFLYWPVTFKRQDVRFWLTYLDKFSQPTPAGYYPPGTDEAEQAKLLQALGALITDGAIILPDGIRVEMLEASRSGTADYAVLYDKMNEAIAKINLSQTMTTESGSSRAQAEVHMDVRQDVVKSDADLVCESFNQGPAKWLTEWNFPGAAAPQVWRKVEDRPDLKAEADTGKVVFGMGFRPTLEWVRERFGPDWEERAGAPSAGAPSAGTPPWPPSRGDATDFRERAPGLRPPPSRGDATAFGEETPDRIDEMTEAMDAATGPIVESWVRRARELVDEAASFEELQERLIELYPNMPAKDFADMLWQAMVAADLAGRSDIEDGV